MILSNSGLVGNWACSLQLFFTAQKQPREVFCKNWFSLKFCKIHWKTPVWSLFFIKLQAEVCNVIKKETLPQVFSCEFFEIFKNTFLTEQPRVAVSSSTVDVQLGPKYTYEYSWKLKQLFEESKIKVIENLI